MENELVNKKQSRRAKLCSISLMVSMIITTLFLIFSLAPFLSAAAGIFMYLILGIGAFIISFGSLGMVWIDEGFRNKWKGAFDFAKRIMDDGEVIASAIGNKIIWISIIIFVVSSFGFVTNLISYCKYKDNKTKFITSIICLSVSLVCLIIADIIYLTYKGNPIG